MKQMSLVIAIKNYLGLPNEHEHPSLLIPQIKALTPKDKEDLKAEFLKIGVEIVIPAAT